MNSIFSWINRWRRLGGLALIGAMMVMGESAIAQSQIIPDETLGEESSQIRTDVEIEGNSAEVIEGGAQRGTNLFHSFKEFNVDNGRGAYFNNPTGIENIFSRVTGTNPSEISGTLGVLGNADLFFINPQGIIFGENARLDLSGSFIGSTANKVNFADGKQFSATELQTTLLTVDVPLGLQYGNNPGSIQVQGNGQGLGADSEFFDTNDALRIEPNETIALVGGQVSLSGANLKTLGGRIEVGSVASFNTVSLTPIEQGWALSYEDVRNFDNIRLSQRAKIDASGKGAGNIQVQGKQVVLTEGSQITNVDFGLGSQGTLNVNASESIEVIGRTFDGEFSSSIATDTLPFASGTNVDSSTTGKGSDIAIKTGSLIVKEGAAISTSSFTELRGGDLTVDAQNIILEDALITDLGRDGTSGLFSRSFGMGDSGNVTVKTRQLAIKNGARISTSTFLSQGGNLNVTASDSIKISGSENQIINAGLFSVTVGPGNAGNLKIATEQLSIQDGGEIGVSTVNMGFGDIFGTAGNIEVLADSIELKQQGSFQATAIEGNGGNINLRVQDLLILDNNSQISATAGLEGTGGDGGNITINTDFLVASPLENNDIIANAFEGDGGSINIDAQSIFGIEQTIATEGNITNDIDASSEFGLSGTVEINTPDVDRDRDLVQLPERPTEKEIVLACAPSDNEEQSEFVIKGSGGLPPSPEEPLDPDALEVDWVSRQRSNSSEITNPVSNEPTSIVEAQGWIVDDKNEIVLVADNSHHESWQSSLQCQQKAEGQNHSSLNRNFDRNILIASNEPQSLTALIPERISINRFEIQGNRAFEEEELTQVLAPFTNKPLSFSELLQARSAITKYYTDRGYITSGAYIPQQRLEDKVVEIQIIEGYLEDIEITGNKRLDSKYFSRRIATASDSLQQEQLLSALQLLQQDPLIETISAELETGTRPGASVLAVEVTEADSFTTPVSFDNRRTPSVGSFRRQLAINEGNLLGFGDSLFLAYSNTEGSDAFDGSYAVPFNADNGTLTLGGGVSSSEVVEEPFNQLNILGDSHYYELSLRQPLVQTPTQEFALGITASRRESDISSLLEEFNISPSELSPGADEDGQTRVSALRFFQEWTSRNSREVIAARSEFSLGLNIFDATVNEDAPDSRFLAWQGQAQWTRQIADDTSFLVRGGVQLATTSLLSSERFGLGGINTLRGYRKDLLLTDNAAFASAEVRLPILRLNQINSVVQLAPFVDLGTAWNNDDEREIESNTLASIGLGLRLSLFNSLIARFDWGIPLVAVDLEEKTWQENGLHFSVEYSPF